MRLALGVLAIGAFAQSLPVFDPKAMDRTRRSHGFLSARVRRLDENESAVLPGNRVANCPGDFDDWKAYLTWQVLRSSALRLPKAFVDEGFRFFGKTLGGQKENEPRW